MKTIVVSGINLFMGGTLKVMQDCIAALSAYGHERDYQIVALVYDERQYDKYGNVRYISFPKSRKSYLHRLYYEYIGFRKLSKELRPYAWLSLHDTTPNVLAERRAVYCHNPFPFYRAKFADLFKQPNIVLLSWLTGGIIYRLNIRKNDYVIVQQEWIREAFRQMYKINNIIVALPMKVYEGEMNESKPDKPQNEKKIFFYPAGPIIHKNFELACQASALLDKEGIGNYEIVLTTDGKENRYTQAVYKKYRHLPNVRFEGLLKREAMNKYYESADCLLFPSKVETWGLPITEAQIHHLPIFIADLKYAKESVGAYRKVSFFDPCNAAQLAQLMKYFLNGTIIYDGNQAVIHREPFTRNWNELFDKLFAS
ncbi:MAG: glycosyltransferase [Dysgonamonadaceae bacterium]|jgi:glycosyltransferase involved in cell wall biosynthesis|nr:glycosyltransferase [Dysgonamonadaceae bacterium]